MSRPELARLLSLARVGAGGEFVPASDDHYEEYVARAEGRPIEIRGKSYWD